MVVVFFVVNDKAAPFNSMTPLTLDVKLIITDRQFGQFGSKLFQIQSQVTEQPQKHVPGDAGKGVKIKGSHAGQPPLRLMRLAAKAAPKPLSMLTTVTPEAQELSIPSRAATPPKAAP